MQFKNVLQTTLKKLQYQLSHFQVMKWKEEKIRKQADTLDQYGKSEAKLLRKYIEEIEYGDATNREGHAAKVYFNALFGMDFTRTEENSE